MKSYLTERGIAFSVNNYIENYGNDKFLKLQKKYIVKTIDRITKTPQVTKLFSIIKVPNDRIIEFPRYSINKLIGTNLTWITPIDNDLLIVDLPIAKQIEMEYIGKSNYNQKLIVDYIFKNVFVNEYNGVTIKQGAGTGKSFTAMDIINRLKLKTLIVVPNTYLLDQWVSLLTQYFPTSKIGVLYGKQKTDGDIIVSIINTIATLKSYEVVSKVPIPNIGKSLKYTKISISRDINHILENIGLSIFDESQMYVSKQFKKVFQRIYSRYTIGLSATPDIREDKLDIIHQSWLGDLLDVETIDGYQLANDAFESDITMVKYYAHNDHCKFKVRDDGLIEYHSIIEAIVTDPNRNNMIIEQIINLANKGHYTFVFSDRRAHLETLYKLLETYVSEKCNDEITLELPETNKKVILYGGSSENIINDAKNNSNIIFTTYAYSSTGVSITKMDGLILTTPRRTNMKQIINRVFRLGSDQTIKRNIIDIVDEKFPIKGQVRERVKAYRERGCNIITTKVQI